MNWLKRIVQWIWALFFGCLHRRTSWPHHSPSGFDYVCCLDCAAELPYSEREMRLLSEEEVLHLRNRLALEQVGLIPPESVLVFSRNDSTAPQAMPAQVGDAA